MATSLSKIKSQIEKLQKQAEAIQSGVIARIKRDIAKHGLTAGDLFGNEIRSVGNGSVKPPKGSKPKASGSTRPAKYADDQGNSWRGMGKRPQWLRDALDAGRRIEEFLIGKVTKPAAAPKPAKKAAAVKKAVTRKKAAPAAKKVAAKAAPKASAKTVARKAPKAAVAAKPARKVATKKAPARKAAKPAATASAVETPAGQA